MKLDHSAFAHVPHLRDKILDPQQSRFRDLDLADMDRAVTKAGSSADWRRTDAEREEIRANFLEGRRERDLWVFAYGSLMWDPAFYFDEVRVAKADGYHRSFCLRTETGRGTPEHPGLMAALDHGDMCEGLAFRIDRAHIEQETAVIWKREMVAWSYEPTFVQLDTDLGTVEALAFVINHSCDRYVGRLDIDESARMIARGAGYLGTNIEYLNNLAVQLELLGLSDEHFFQLHDRALEYL